MSFLSHTSLHDLLHRYGYSALAVIIALECMGLLLPGETLLLGGAIYAAATGKVDIRLIVGAAAAGAILGNVGGYLMGRLIGHRLLRRYGRHLGLTEHRLKLGQYLFLRHGGKVIMIGRFLAFLRSFTSLLAGANHMPWGSFMFYNVVSGVAWPALYGFAAFYLGRSVKSFAGPAEFVIGGLVAVALVTGFIFLKRNEARLTAEAERVLANAPENPAEARTIYRPGTSEGC